MSKQREAEHSPVRYESGPRTPVFFGEPNPYWAPWSWTQTERLRGILKKKRRRKG